MLTMMATLLLTLITISLGIFAVIAVTVGMVWLLWPILTVAIILIAVGYSLGKKKGGNGPEKIEDRNNN